MLTQEEMNSSQFARDIGQWILTINKICRDQPEIRSILRGADAPPSSASPRGLQRSQKTKREDEKSDLLAIKKPAASRKTTRA